MESIRTYLNQIRQYLTPHQYNLLVDCETVLSLLPQDHISDYSFIVAPAAKAYEGFLKDFFLKAGIIDKTTHESDRFRVGKTLNPSLRYKRFSIYKKLVDMHDQGEELAESLWDAWKYGRNEIFHYFPNQLKNLPRSEAENRINQILKAISLACKFIEEEKLQKYNLL